MEEVIQRDVELQQPLYLLEVITQQALYIELKLLKNLMVVPGRK